MEHWNAFVDYFMDFEKVRKFQELCGLKEEEEYNKDVEQLIKDMGKEQQLCKNGKMCTKNNQDDGSDSFKVQKKTYKVTNPLLHYMFLFGSMMGTEIFYITFTPILFWTIDIFIARKVVTVWVVTMYLGQAAKDILRWPRPTFPPVFKLERRVQAEYGLPSTHAIAATAFPFTMLVAAVGRYDFRLEIGIILACCWCLLVCLSRLYVGMHSILDVLAGISLTAAYLYFGWPFMELVDDYTLHSKYAPYIIVVSHFLLAIFYPISDRSSTTRGDTVIILGVGAGVHCASWLSTMYGFNWNPSGSPPYNISLPTLWQIWIGSARYVIGMIILLSIRALAKNTSLRIICHAVSVSKDDELSRRRTEVEVPYKFLTYSCVGMGVGFFVPFFFECIGLNF